jgi:carboxymethylenebutenolidase
MQAAGKDFTYHIYEGAPHAFFNDTCASYTAGAARHVWAHTLAFLCRHLDGSQEEHGEVR